MIGAPRPVRERIQREPDEQDFQLRDLVGYMAKGLVDHPDDVSVEILSAGDDGVLELHVQAGTISARHRQAGTHRALAAASRSAPPRRASTAG